VSASEGPESARWAEATVPAGWAEDRREGKEHREVEKARTSCWFGIAVAPGSIDFEVGARLPGLLSEACQALLKSSTACGIGTMRTLFQTICTEDRKDREDPVGTGALTSPDRKRFGLGSTVQHSERSSSDSVVGDL
jgi:hypothetical protein